MFKVIDDLLEDPHGYRAAALHQPFSDVELGGQVFKGIAKVPNDEVLYALKQVQPQLTPTLSFIRKSPEGQAEPNFIHTDEMMGQWTGILYLNPKPHRRDGTDFWIFDGEWEKIEHIAAKFNRLLLFSSEIAHSRALFENYGKDTSARLIHVTFGIGEIS